MQLKEAIELIAFEKFKPIGKQSWYDLGAGSGLFSVALANLLDSGSKIVSIDKDTASLRQIPKTANNTSIETIKQDFTSSDLPYNEFDGILMANSLHYVENKMDFLSNARINLKPNHSFIIVEYDTEKSNPWVPYPLGFSSLKKLFNDLGYEKVIKMHERKSRFGGNMMYSALVMNHD
ncbi:MAG: class I SAM-dependent methyltransferase [Bacteroidetes bacterium]|nr:class I SAM-dependent methyltransferase [Bacteroidota bacterium]